MTSDTQTIPDDIIEAAKKSADALITRMCVTMDHSFGLQSEQEQRGLRTSMSQLVEHDVAPAMASALYAERKRSAAIAKDATMATGAPLEQMGDEVAAAVLQQPETQKFWMVYGVGTRGPTYRHFSKAAAKAEAQRLAALHPETMFVVLAAVDAYSTEKPAMVRFTLYKTAPLGRDADDDIPF
ncbi:MAG: hypothetical protein LCH99_36785 [Proteobacteria bacterium]|nr:hypothetical protein [Pseudomonadota bacterium]